MGGDGERERERENGVQNEGTEKTETNEAAQLILCFLRSSSLTSFLRFELRFLKQLVSSL
jgi:hypothetical protein